MESKTGLPQAQDEDVNLGSSLQFDESVLLDPSKNRFRKLMKEVNVGESSRLDAIK